jgi:hypothetical protein
MKKVFTLVVAITTFSITGSSQVDDSPVTHMSFLNDKEEVLQKNYMSYMSEVSHGGRARKMEKRRQELITSIQAAIKDATRLKPYKGDASLKNAFIEYWNILLHLFREDYHKIVDMEEVAEQSYDAMEAYMLAQEKAEETLAKAYQKIPTAYESFAATHKVTLVEGSQSKLTKKLEQVSKVNYYVKQLFLIYFKSAVQDTHLADAMKASDLNGVEQNKNALLKYSGEGLSRLDTIKSFGGDASLKTACRKVLEFHKAEAETRIPPMSDYLIKYDEFLKTKKSFDNKPASSRTQSDVDAYNKAVNDINKDLKSFNKNSEELFNGRNKILANWEQTKKSFMDQHIPYK